MKAVKILLGAVLILLGLFLVYHWWGALLLLIKGSIGLVLILAGVIAFAVAGD